VEVAEDGMIGKTIGRWCRSQRRDNIPAADPHLAADNASGQIVVHVRVGLKRVVAGQQSPPLRVHVDRNHGKALRSQARDHLSSLALSVLVCAGRFDICVLRFGFGVDGDVDGLLPLALDRGDVLGKGVVKGFDEFGPFFSANIFLSVYSLNKPVDVLGQAPLNFTSKEAPRPVEDVGVIDKAPCSLFDFGWSLGKQPGNAQAGILMGLGPGPFMPVQTTGPLQQQVHRRQVGQHEVEIQVQALLHNLSGYEHGAAGSERIFSTTKIPQHLSFPLAALVRRIAGMEQHQGRVAPKSILKQLVHVLGALDRIDNDRSAAASVQARKDVAHHFGQVLGDSLDGDWSQGPARNMLSNDLGCMRHP
jgi:hypothetical protein